MDPGQADLTNPINSGAYDPRVRLWASRRQRSQELKQNGFIAKWRSYWQWYRNYVVPLDDPADWWRSNEQIPTVFKIIETLLPRYVTGMFDSPDWFTVEARSPFGEEYERKCFELLKTTLEEMKVFPEMTEALRYALVMGHAWGKVLWKSEIIKRQRLIYQDVDTGVIDETTGQRQTAQAVMADIVEELVYDNPTFEWRTLDIVFPDPSGRGRWYIEDIDTTLADIQETQRHEGIYDEEALHALEARLMLAPIPDANIDSIGTASVGTAGVYVTEYQREPDMTEGIPQYIVNPMREGRGCKLWQCWGYVDPEYRGEDGCEWRLIVIADGQYILRDVPAPTPDMKPPYFPIKSIPVPKILYGESIIHYIGPMADQQSRIANMRLDEIFLNIWQTFLAKANAIPTDNQLITMPGAVVPVNLDANQSLKDVFEPVPRRPVFTESWTEDQYRQTQAEHAAAATDITQGVEATGGGGTATEAQLRVQQGNARHLLQVMWNDYTVKRELLERVWRWLQMRMTQPRVIKEVGEPIDLRHIQYPIDINVGGGLFALSKQARLQMDQELVQLLNIPQFAAVAKPDEIFRQLLMDRGWKKVDRFFKTPQEIHSEQQQMAVQNILAGGQPPIGGGPGMPPALGGGTNMPPLPPQGAEASLAGGLLGPPPPGPLTAG